MTQKICLLTILFIAAVGAGCSATDDNHSRKRECHCESNYNDITRS